MTLAAKNLLLNVRVAVALLAGLYLLFVLVQQFRSDTDPSLRYTTENAAGSTSMLLSGTHVTIVLAGVIALATWPLVMQSTGLLVALGGAVLVHFVVEKMEDRRAAS
jgi:hypothetical protein